MGALLLERMTWPEVRAEVEGGRDTVVVPFGAVEQHGPHLPLGTDAMFGDEIGRAAAERLNAFLAPTIRVGCSHHHLAFAGTMSLEEETFHRVVGDIVKALAAHGFKRIVLLPTHGGNFRPLGEALARLGPLEGVKIIAFTDVGVLASATIGVGAELGITPAEGGIHAGEWETSMMLALRPELVSMERAEPGYVGDLASGLERFFSEGVHVLADNGVFGDPRRASATAGEKYIERLVDQVVRTVEES
ncbi:MAG: creatininase family protein [Dehalococcoidia bacterium]|nr:MAG: creatininase family protein [Dehalococcoidia bacterium]